MSGLRYFASALTLAAVVAGCGGAADTKDAPKAASSGGGGAKLALHHYSFIDGVRVSGTLRVSGRAGVQGTLTVHGQRVRGRVAGQSVDVHMALNLFALTA